MFQVTTKYLEWCICTVTLSIWLNFRRIHPNSSIPDVLVVVYAISGTHQSGLRISLWSKVSSFKPFMKGKLVQFLSDCKSVYFPVESNTSLLQISPQVRFWRHLFASCDQFPGWTLLGELDLGILTFVLNVLHI